MIDHCILTGAGSGIGQAVALRLADRGIPLLLVGRHDSNERTRQQVLARRGRADLFACDLEDHQRNLTGLREILAAWPAGRWGVVLAASILDPSAQGLAAYEKVFRTNVIGNLAVLEACLPRMREAGFGRVVFFAGGGAAYAYPLFPAYALSKTSTVRLVENLAAVDPPSSGLSFVCLAPGAVETPMLARVVAAGGEVKTKTSIAEPVEFVERYLESESTALSGRYLHVRDEWPAYLRGEKSPARDQFYLRRIQ